MTTSNTESTTKVCGNCAFYQPYPDREAGLCYGDVPAVNLNGVSADVQATNPVRPFVEPNFRACRHWQPLEWRNLEG